MIFLAVASCPSLQDIIDELDQNETTRVINPPVFEPAGVTQYGDMVTMECIVNGGNNITRSRRCLFDYAANTYALLGDPVDCPGEMRLNDSVSDITGCTSRIKRFVDYITGCPSDCS